MFSNFFPTGFQPILNKLRFFKNKRSIGRCGLRRYALPSHQFKTPQIIELKVWKYSQLQKITRVNCLMMNDQVWIDYVAALIGFQMEILILSFTVLRHVNPLKDSQIFFSDSWLTISSEKSIKNVKKDFSKISNFFWNFYIYWSNRTDWIIWYSSAFSKVL